MKNKKQDGFITEIVLVVVALVILKYFFHLDIVGYLSDGPLSKIFIWVGDRFK